jgi:hypothetical protein
MSGSSVTRTFTATVEDGERDGLAIAVPFDPDEVWGPKRRHHVSGTVAGADVRAVIERHGAGWGIVMGPRWSRCAGVGPGATVAVTLSPEGPQRGDLAPDVLAAFDAEPAAGEFFDSLARFYRVAWLTWVDGTKRRPDLRAERIASMVEHLRSGRRERPR